MSFADSIADLLTRIRNAHMRSHKTVQCGASSMARALLSVLREEGYITDFHEEDVRPGIKKIVVDLRYFEEKPAIKSIRRISTPGRRTYSPVEGLKKVCNGLGVSVLSTSKGVISDGKARLLNVGGEVLFEVY